MKKASNVAIVVKCGRPIKDRIEQLVNELDVPWYNLNHRLELCKNPTIDYTDYHKHRPLGKELRKRRLNRIILVGGHFGACHASCFIDLARDMCQNSKDVEFIFPLESIYDVNEKDISDLPIDYVIRVLDKEYFPYVRNVLPKYFSLLNLLTFNRFQSRIHPNCKLFVKGKYLKETNPNERPIIKVNLFNTNQEVIDYV